MGTVMLLVAGIAASSLSAGIDGDVQWDSISHIGFTDRRPLCPVNGESFSVRFKAARGDLTGARVGVDFGADGGEILWLDMVQSELNSRYDEWSATIPATSAARLSYFFELIDQPDRN